MPRHRSLAGAADVSLTSGPPGPGPMIKYVCKGCGVYSSYKIFNLKQHTAKNKQCKENLRRKLKFGEEAYQVVEIRFSTHDRVVGGQSRELTTNHDRQESSEDQYGHDIHGNIPPSTDCMEECDSVAEGTSSQFFIFKLSTQLQVKKSTLKCKYLTFSHFPIACTNRISFK